MLNYVMATMLILFSINLSAKELKCNVQYDIMYLIALNEKSPKRAVGYPYLISFNNKSDAKMIKTKYSNLFMSSRTIDCENFSLCVSKVGVVSI